MPIPERVALYREFEKARGRPLIVFVTSSRPNMTVLMASDAVPELLDQLSAIPKTETAVDLLIVSNGGDPTVAWRFMSLLRERFINVAVIVPQAAFSAATLLALGADEIVMHPHGNLGPVDPQFTVPRKGSNQPGDVMRFGLEELTGYFEFAKTHAGVTDQAQLQQLFAELSREVGAVSLGIASRGSRLLMSMGKQLLEMHMQDDGAAQQAQEIAAKLSTNFAHHGYPLSRREAKQIGLKVTEPSADVETLMWSIWLDIEAELKVRRPFSAFDELAHDPGSAPLFAPLSNIQMPANLPPQLAQQAYNQILQQVTVTPVGPTTYLLPLALMESLRHASRFEAEGRLLACRLPTGQIQVTDINVRASWVPMRLSNRVLT